MIEDPYKILGVSPQATDEEIKAAYRKLAKQYHPDRNPGDAEAAKKMQQINAAYEQIKNPEKAARNGGGQGYGGQSYGGYDPFGGFNPFGGGYTGGQTRQDSQQGQYHRAAEQYIRFDRYQEALNALQFAPEKDARWYYLSALANDGLGNQVTALEHIKRAVSMEPDNAQYLYTLEQIQGGGSTYRKQAGNFRGFTMGTSPCASLCMCYALQMCCCRGRIFCC